MDVSILLSMAGGLGLFLFGMHTMSEAIEKAAGARLRSILEFFTTNRFTGMLVGVIFTAIIQSSSACTVMVVSFVNSGLMNLYQAAGVIFGANICYERFKGCSGGCGYVKVFRKPAACHTCGHGFNRNHSKLFRDSQHRSFDVQPGIVRTTYLSFHYSGM